MTNNIEVHSGISQAGAIATTDGGKTEVIGGEPDNIGGMTQFTRDMSAAFINQYLSDHVGHHAWLA